MALAHVAICSLFLFNVVLGVYKPQNVHLSFSNSPTQMNVVWYTEQESKDATVEYGTRSGDYHLSTPGISTSLEYGTGYIHRATLRHLTPASIIYFRIGNQLSVEQSKEEWVFSNEFQFKVRPNESQMNSHTIRMVAYGDQGVSQSAEEVIKSITTREVEPGKLDFVMHAGDMAYAFEQISKWNTWFENIQSISAYVPYMICPGNRDDEAVIRERFTMPMDSSESNMILKPENKSNFYYSFDYGFLHVVTISIKDRYEPGSPQYRWLEQDLKLAHQRMSNARDPLTWIILVGHTPLYSSSAGHTGGNKDLKNAIEHLLSKYRVSLCIWGDDHAYERSYPIYDEVPDYEMQVHDGIQSFVRPNKTIHLLVGTGGIGLDDWTSDKPPEWSAFREKSHGYMKLEISKQAIRGRFTRINGTLADEFVILNERQGVLINSNVDKEGGLSSYTILWIIPAVILAFVYFRKRRTNSFNTTSVLPTKST